MVSPAVGKVILVPFPFSDLSESKLRPAVVLADAQGGDWILCQVTSNPYGDPHVVRITDESFSHGLRRIASFARSGKPFTASFGLMLGEIGMLKTDVTRQIINSIIEMLKRGMEEGEIDPGPTG